MRDILDLSQFYVVAMVILFILMFFLPYRMWLSIWYMPSYDW
jgi:hypothetical protein